MKDNELQFDRECHVLYSKACKKQIQAKIAMHYPEAQREAVWERVQRQYVEFLSDWRTDLGGKKNFHMDIMNGAYAEGHFPCKLWDAGEKGLTLSVFEWDSRSKIMLYGQKDYAYGERLTKPDFCEGNPIRLYCLPEIRRIFGTLGMEVIDAYSDFSGLPASDKGIQLMVVSRKKPS